MIKFSEKFKKVVALTTAVMLTAGIFTSSVLAKTKENKNPNDFAVMVKDKCLSAVNLSKSGKEVVIDKNGVFKNPKISPNGEKVAYTKGEGLYVSSINLKQGNGKSIKVADKIVSYVWGSNNDLAYSTEKGGLNGFNVKTKKVSIYVKSEERYEYMASDKKGKVYSEVYRYYTKPDGQYIEAKGLMKYDLYSYKKNMIIKARPWNDETGDIGLSPRVAGISKDSSYVYIWCRSSSGSINADGVSFGVYNAKNNKFTIFNKEEIYALAYKDNLAINPVNSKIPVLNKGGVRNMNVNKTIGTLDITNGKFKALLPQNIISITNDPYNTTAKGMVTMTPNFSPNGKKLIYSASKANSNIDQWTKSPHNIYTVDMTTKKIEKITKGNTFDFAPKYISKGKSIVFARKAGSNTISLISIKGNKEKCMAKGIKLDENDVFYGHYELENSLDIYITGL